MAEQYFYGQGKVKLAKIIGGVRQPWRWVGDVSALSTAFAEEKASHRESYSGKKSKVREFNITNDMTVNATFHDLGTENLVLFTQGTATENEAGTVTAELLRNPVAAGDEVALENPGVSDVVITDSTGTPATIDPEHYELDPAYGNILFLSLPDPAPTMPLKAAYTYAANKSVSFLSAPQQQVALRYEGINLAEGGAPVIVELYKLSPGLLQELALITDGNDVAGMQVTGSVLLDSSKSATGPYGQYGRIVQLTA